MTTQTIEFPAPCELINANQRMHWAQKAKLTKAWREATWAQAKLHNLRPVDRARVIVWFDLPPRSRLREASNLQPTVKACVDGLTDAGLWPDDDDQHVTAQEPRRGDIRDQVWVTIEIIPDPA